MDLIVGAVAWFSEQLTSMSLPSVLLLAALAGLPTLGTLIHEVGHACAASRRGVPVRQIVAAGEGPALTFRVRGIDVRVGLGLGRDLRSRDPEGFVELGGPMLTSRDAIAILIAGPKAQALYAVALLVLTVAPLPILFRWTIGLAGAEALIMAIANAAPSSKGASDGALIKAIRAELRERAESPSIPSPHAETSVAPPPHG